MNEKAVTKKTFNPSTIGWVASIMTIIMFSSYIDQIRLNLTGHPGSIILPITTIFNSFSWLLYGVVREKIDWPIVLCNLFGITLGLTTFVTAILG